MSRCAKSTVTRATSRPAWTPPWTRSERAHRTSSLPNRMIAGENAIKPLGQLLDSLARDASLLVVGDGVSPDVQRIRVINLKDSLDLNDLSSEISLAATQAAARREDRLLEKSIAEQQYEAFEGIVGVSGIDSPHNRTYQEGRPQQANPS